MKQKILLMIVFTLLVVGSLWADLPQDVKKYLAENLTEIYRYIPTAYSNQQIEKILQRLTNLVIDKFPKSAEQLSENRLELYDELKKSATPADAEEPAGTLAVKNEKLASAIRDNEKAKKLVSAYEGKLVDGMLVLTYKNAEIPFKIDPFVHRFILELLGVPLEQDSFQDSCLKATLTTKEAKISWLGTVDTACPAPLDNQGSFLLTMVEDFARLLEIPMVTLNDGSEVVCKLNQEKVDFRILRIFQTGRSWYESKGYHPISESDAENYQEKIDKFRQYKNEDLLDDLSTETNSGINTDVVAKYIEQLARYRLIGTNDTFSDFMAWLYNDNCALYTEIFSEFLPYQRNRRTLKINQLVPPNPKLKKDINNY